MNRKIILTLFIVLGFRVQAQNTSATGTNVEALSKKPVMKVQTTVRSVKQPKGENLLDFEAEVIEGEKKRPELFLDIKAGDGDVGSGLYIRPNFDDFFVVDKKRRARFIKSK